MTTRQDTLTATELEFVMLCLGGTRGVELSPEAIRAAIPTMLNGRKVSAATVDTALLALESRGIATIFPRTMLVP